MRNGNSSNPIVTDCVFFRNVKANGSGMMNDNDSNPTVIRCQFIENDSASGGHPGGGMWNADGSSPTLYQCVFIGNTATEGGGMRNRDGSSPTLIQCSFIGNSSEKGGGIYNRDSTSRPTLIHCVFEGNSSVGLASAGGGTRYPARPFLSTEGLSGAEKRSCPARRTVPGRTVQRGPSRAEHSPLSALPRRTSTVTS